MGKTTNKLLAIADAAIEGKREEYIRQLHDLRDFHSREARLVVAAERPRRARPLSSTSISRSSTELVKGLAVLGELTPRSVDAISSYGERLSSYIVTLGFPPLRHARRARGFARGDRHRQPPHAGRARLSRDLRAPGRRRFRRWPRDSVVVMGGFIGSTEDGVTTTLGRGGSDFTAAIVGAGIDAEEIQIWTDVDGMLTADPTHPAGRPPRQDHLVRRSRRTGLLRRQGAASGHRACRPSRRTSRC